MTCDLTPENKKNIEKDYKKGATYKEIQEKYEITKSQLIYLIQRNKWKRKSNRSKSLKGNQNAVGNKGGPGAGEQNQNAVTTGEYANIFNTVFSDEENNIYKNITINDDKKEPLLEELKILTIREFRMLKRIKELDSGMDMTVNSISKNSYKNSKWNSENTSTTTTHVEHKNIMIQKIEEALTRVQEAKRRCVDSLHKIENDDRKLELDIIRLEMEAAKESETSNEENIKDDSFIKALEDSTEAVWEDYEEEVNTDESKSEKEEATMQ